MSDEPKSVSDSSQKDRLPFEKGKNRKKPAKTPPSAPATAAKQTQQAKVSKDEMTIPDVVSKRMARRMALLCGVPTFLGMLTFVASYVIVSNHWLKLPNIAVLLVSMGFFGLGVLGLTYGVLSASWDEETPGSILGWNEFTTNWGRMLAAWRGARQKDVSS